MTAASPKGAKEGRVVAVNMAGRTFAEVMREAEAQYLAACMEAGGFNRREAAERAGLAYETFRRRFAAARPLVTISIRQEPAA